MEADLNILKRDLEELYKKVEQLNKKVEQLDKAIDKIAWASIDITEEVRKRFKAIDVQVKELQVQCAVKKNDIDV
jgi:predicted  nucleic acid-binding Zn-ribbon protein